MTEQVTVNINDLIISLKTAYERMGVQNSHKHLLGAAAGVVIALYQENIQLKAAALPPEPAPLVTLV